MPIIAVALIRLTAPAIQTHAWSPFSAQTTSARQGRPQRRLRQGRSQRSWPPAAKPVRHGAGEAYPGLFLPP
jgi:hypothetical protein